MIPDLITLAFFDAAAFFDWFVQEANYLFVFLFMTIESSFIPFPSEIVVPPAAYLAMQPDSGMNIYGVCLMATLGALAGSIINYYIAVWIGRPIIYAFAESRLGHICLLNREKVVKAEKYFDDHGGTSTFFGRLIPVIRQLISLPAGLARMNFAKFCFFTTIGALIWNITLCLLGYFLSLAVPLDQLYDKVEEYNTYLTYIGYAIGGCCLMFIIWTMLKPRSLDNTL